MERTMFRYFQRSVERFPHKDFQRIKAGGRFKGVTYHQAYESVLEMGTGLLNFGVGKDDKVAVICDNRPEWILINLALQGIGAQDVPRDSAVPLPELKGILDDSKARFLIVENEDVLDRIHPALYDFPSIAATFVMDASSRGRENIYTLQDVVTEGRTQLTQGSNALLEAADRVSTDDVCTIVYTSGTQGIPKGTVLTHSNFAYIFEVVPPLLDVTENDRVLSFLPPWHLFERAIDYIVFAMGGSLSYTTPKDVLTDLALEKPTFFASVPRVWTALYERAYKEMRRQRPPLDRLLPNLVEKAIAYKKAGNRRKGRYPYPSANASDRFRDFKDTASNFLAYKLADLLVFSRLRKMLGGELRGAIFGGAHLPEHVEDFLDAAGLEVLEAYGMTEASPVLTVRLYGGTLYTAGKPIPGTEIQILDKYLNPVEPGTQGVIYARGPQIMKGYTSLELTSRVLSPSSDGQPLKWYNTGDFGVITPTGDLKILGRVGDDFKLVNGEWVIPQPIEDMIRTSPFVHEVMLVGADRKFVGALVFPEWDAVERYAREHQIQYLREDSGAGHSDLSKNKDIRELMGKEIRARASHEKGIRHWEEVVKFAVIPQELRMGAELTATIKLRRHFVMQEYADLIEDLYR
ncbi:MAG: AMP-binding protein [Anaerolineae bacterium]|nr:AMP-binding protein [Anaerolineae bacterium]